MTRRDHYLAAQAARSLQHVARLKSLYSVAPPPDPDAARLRTELADAAAHAGPAASAISTPAQADSFVIRLHGLARLAQRLRQSLEEVGE